MSRHGQSGFLRRSRDWEAGLGEACSHVGAIISKISVPGVDSVDLSTVFAHQVGVSQ